MRCRCPRRARRFASSRPWRSALAALALGAGLPLGAQAAGTPSGSITLTNNFVPDQAMAGGTGHYRLELTSTLGQALTGVRLPVELNSVAESITSGSSSCGGALSGSGLSQEWTGLTVPAATGPTAPSTCTVDVTFRVRAQTGSYTASLPVSAITTDQGLSNSNSSAKTLVVVPPKPLGLEFAFNPWRPDALGYSNTVMLHGLNTLLIEVRNPTGAAVEGLELSQTLPSPLALRVRPLGTPTCSDPADLASATAAQASATLGASEVRLQGLNLSEGAHCVIGLEVAFSQYPDRSFAWEETSPVSASSQTSSTLRVTDSLSGVSGSVSELVDVGSAMNLSLHFGGDGTAARVGSNTYNLRSVKGERFPMTVMVSNGSVLPSTISFTHQLPGSLTLDETQGLSARAVELETRDPRDPALGAPSCSTAGLSVNWAAGTITAQDVAVTPRTLCQYVVWVRKPAVLAGTLVSEIASSTVGQANALYSRPPGSVSSGTAARAELYDREALTGSKTGSGASAWGAASYVIALTNSDSAAPLTGLHFTDRWTHGLNISDVENSCGGTMTIDDDRKGIRLDGGMVPASGTCHVTLRIAPESALPGSYNNVTSAITHDAGSISPLSGALVLKGMTTVIANPQSSSWDQPDLMTPGVPARLGFLHQPGVQIPGTYVFEADLPPSLHPDLSAGVQRACWTWWYNRTFSWVDPSKVSFTGGTLRIEEDIPAGSPMMSQNCTYHWTATADGPADYRIPARVSFNGVTLEADTRWGRNGLMVNAVSQAPISYAANVRFAQTTLRPGEQTFLTVEVLQAGGGTTISAPRGSAQPDRSPEYAPVTLTLPGGLRFSTGGTFLPNQPDGRYVSPTAVPQLVDDSATLTTGGLPCTEISADRRTLINRCRSDIRYLTVDVERYGDLTLTLLPSQVQPFHGAVQGPASATVSVTRGLIVNKTFDRASTSQAQPFEMILKVTNVAAPGDGTDTIEVRDNLSWASMTPADPQATSVPVTGSCGAGASGAYDSASGVLTLSGLQLDPGQSCEARVGLRSQNVWSEQSRINWLSPGDATSVKGSSNAVPTMARILVRPAITCGRAEARGGPLSLVLGGTRGVLALVNTGESDITNANLSSNVPATLSVRYGLSAGAEDYYSAQQAWDTWRSANGALKVGESTDIHFTVRPTAQAVTGSTQTMDFTFQVWPSSGDCVSPQATFSGEVAPEGAPLVTVTTLQAACADAWCSGATWQREPIDVQPCSLVGYQITALNTGEGRVRRAQLSTQWPAGLQLVLGYATQMPPGAYGMWLSDSGSLEWSPVLRTGDKITLTAERDYDWQLSTGDTLDPGETMSMVLVGQVGGCP